MWGCWWRLAEVWDRGLGGQEPIPGRPILGRWICTGFGGLSWGCTLHCLIGLHLNTQFKAKMIEKFRDGTGCMLKQAVLFEFSFWIFFFTSLRWLHLSEKAISPLCQVGGIVNLSIFPSSSKGLIFNVFLKGDFLYFGKDGLMIFVVVSDLLWVWMSVFWNFTEVKSMRKS